jgi:ribosomal-protein-alanine N-acetyltransferase
MISLLRITAENQQGYLEPLLDIETRSFPTPWSAAAFIQEIRNPITRLWAAVVNGKPAGFIVYWVLDLEVDLLTLAVHPEQRRKGLGRLLLTHIVEEAAAMAVGSLWLEVRVSNNAAINLYRAFGFERAGLRRKYYDTQEDAIVMCLPISKSACTTPHSPLLSANGGEGEGVRCANPISRR